MPLAAIGGTETYWQQWGTGARRALLVHCALAQSSAWAGMAWHLSDRLNLQAFDMPGYGKSGPWDQSRDYQDQTIAMALGLIGDDPVDLIGHSYGAVVCLRLAVEHPELVRSLTLIEPVFFALAAMDARACFDEYIRGSEPFVKAMIAGEFEKAAQHFTATWGDGKNWEELPAAQRRKLADEIWQIEATTSATFEDRADLLRRGRLAALGMSVLLIEGKESPPIIGAIHNALAKRLPHVKRARIAQAGHMLPITHAADVAAEVAGFLNL